MNQEQRLDATFLALADPTRRAILARLALGEATVQELGAPFSLSQPAISKHLKVLERAGLVRSAREGTRRPRTLSPEPLVQASECLERFREVFEQNYQRLDALLAELVDAATENAVTEDAAERTRQTTERTRPSPERSRQSPERTRTRTTTARPRAGAPPTRRTNTKRRKP